MKTTFSQKLLSFSLAISALASAPPFTHEAHATSTLKQVQVTNGSEIDLLFDSKVSKSQIKTEFFNDVIQISLMDVSVYPAKISSVSGGNITKIFAYQYAPKLVRCRLTVKGKAESFKDKIQILSGAGTGKLLTVRVGSALAVQNAFANTDEDDKISVQAERAKEPQANTEAGAQSAAPKINDKEEKALLDRVLKSAPAEATLEKAAPEKVVAKTETHDNSDSRDFRNEKNIFLDKADAKPGNLAGGKPLPSPMNALGKLALVVALFGACALGFKKFWKARAQSPTASAGLMNSLGKFAQNLGHTVTQGKGRSKKMIEVISNHHLGPKKSIAVVRVAGHMLVLGITDDAINLITRIPDGQNEGEMDAALEEAIVGPDLETVLGKTAKQGVGATSAGPAIFSDILKTETAKPAMGAPIANNRLARPQASMAAPVQAPPQTAPRKDARVTNYGALLGAQTQAQPAPAQNNNHNAFNATAAAGLSGVRAQIRSKLEGLKQI
jgi:flagellar biogenesis protein FliO